ncbi:hypothetical protein ABTX77_19870 [Streptomyces sp. NPDC097704]|uniref:hypothetical protein n=1 Tax=Streptomyces sp. NPDC097704 TaxID=3157101 RepID=UPI0033339DE7
MHERNDHAAGRDRRAVTIRWIQVALIAVVVLLFGFRTWGRDSGGSSSIVFGLMAASALSVGVLERHRASATKRSR